MKKVYNPLYFIGQAFRSLWRNGVMSFASIAVLMSCLVVMGGFVLLVLNIDSNLERINKMNQIVVFCYNDATEEEIVKIEEQIKALDGVESVVRTTKTEGVEIMKNEAPEEDRHVYDDITPENNPLSDTFTVTYTPNADFATLHHKLSTGIEGVRKVNARVELAKTIESFKDGVKQIFFWFLVILFVVTIFIIINTIKLALHARRHEISVMRYVGATGWFITLPFVFEGIIIGLFAAGLGFAIETYIYRYVINSLSTDLSMISIIPYAEVGVPMVLGFLAVGIVTGVVGSCISIGKYLKS